MTHQSLKLIVKSVRKFFNFNRMMYFIKTFKIMNENKFRFQQEKSCKSDLISFTEFLRNSVDKCLKGLARLTDLKKHLIPYAIKQLLNKTRKVRFPRKFSELNDEFSQESPPVR